MALGARSWILLAGIGAAAAAIVWAGSGARQPIQGPKGGATPEPAATAPGTAGADATATDAALERAEAETPPRTVTLTPAAAAFLAKARTSDELSVVVAEVLAVSPSPFASKTNPSEWATLHLLTNDHRGRFFADNVVMASIDPLRTAARYGVATPLGSLVPGQVREVVLGSLGLLGAMLDEKGLVQLVLAGPEVPRTGPDPAAQVPFALKEFVYRRGFAVLKARVVGVGERRGNAANAMVGLPEIAEQIDVDVVEIVGETFRPVQPGQRMRLLNMSAGTLASTLPAGAAQVGETRWFVIQDVLLMSVVLRSEIAP